jgi:nicotinamide mononucleotide transporter
MNELFNFFIDAYKNASTLQIALEVITFFFGIASVYLAKKENIWVYPTGLIATSITVYLLYVAGYYGDMVINFYYSVMSIYGWYNWSRKTGGEELPITRTSKAEKLTGVGMFFLTIVVIFAVYKMFGYPIKTENYFDIFTAGIFFTAMWYMALKKIENWTLWIIGDLIVIPLYAYRGLGMLSLQYVFFTILAIQAYLTWRKILNNSR